STVVPPRVWWRVASGAGSSVVPGRVWWRVASGAASSVAPHRVWAASSVELAGVSRPPKPPNSTLDVPGRSGATPRWGHAAGGPRRGGTGHAAVGPRRGGAGHVAAGRGGLDCARAGGGCAGRATVGPGQGRPGYGGSGFGRAGPARARRSYRTSPSSAAICGCPAV